MINFVYITTNLINKKQYIGDHSTNDINCFRTKNYLGSGCIIQKALKKHGKKNFKREILEFFPTKQEAFDAQEKYIKEYNTLEPNGYNISPKGGLHTSNCHSYSTLQKISKSNTGKKRSKESIKKMSNSQKNRKIPGHFNYISKEQEITIIYLHLMFNRGITDISKILNISHNSIKTFLKKHNYYKGRIFSKEAADKLSKERKGVKRSIEICKKMSNSLKGHVPWNKGLTKDNDIRLVKKQKSSKKGKTYIELYGEEKANEIISNQKNSNSGKKRTQEQCKNISNSLKGKKHTKQHIKNNSIAHIGKISPNKGKHYTIDENGKKKIVNQ